MNSNSWYILERLVSSLALAFCTFAIWYALLRVEEKQAIVEHRQASSERRTEAALEAIRQQMKDDAKWQSAVNSLNANSQK